MKTKNELSSGCVVYQKKNNTALYALGKHSGYHKWVLPKGLVEKGEDKIKTAVRETEEELGLKVKVTQTKPIYLAKYTYYADLKKQEVSSYMPEAKSNNSKGDKSTRRIKKYQEQGGNKTRVSKTVYFYLAEFDSGDIAKHGWEMSDANWFTLDKALYLLSFKEEKEALKVANHLLKS